MAKYLYFDGTGGRLQLPSMPFTEIILDMSVIRTTDAVKLYVDGRTGVGFCYFQSNTNGTDSWSSFNNVYVDGISKSNNTTMVPNNQRCSVRLVRGAGTDDLTIFSNNSGGNAFVRGNLYNVKIYNGTTLQAHYDMSTGTVQDQSGNGRHATLTGGTWLDDGTGGTPTGEDGSVSVDTKQVMYQDGANLFDIRSNVYQDGMSTFDLRNILYQDGSTSSDTKQVLYQISSTSFDMLQEIFNDGQVGSTPFDMSLLLYSDDSILHDSRQAMYESGQNAFDLSQAIYEEGNGKGDIHLVLFADSSTHHDLIQSLYEDAAVHFDTKQILFSPDQQKIGTIRLKGKRDLYVYLIAKQDLIVPLKAKRELTVSLKGGVNMTMQNQNFSMFAGDTKYITFSIGGADDLTGATITWGARQSSYSTGESILVKSTGDGITVENGEVRIKLDPEDTELLNGTYHHECELKDNLNNVSTVFTGLMTVNKSAV